MAQAQGVPPKEKLETRLKYNYDNGQLTWIAGRRKGKIAGNMHRLGYRRIWFGDKGYQEHRIIWTLCGRGQPPNEIDHIDQNKSNNRIENLRAASRALNAINRGLVSTNTSGYSGVYRDSKCKKFAAAIGWQGKMLYLGLFVCPKLAHQAYLNKRMELHGF